MAHSGNQGFREFRLTAIEPPGYRPKPRARVPVERIGVIGAPREILDQDGRLIGLAQGGLVLTRYQDGGWGTVSSWAPITSTRAWQVELGLSRVTGTWPIGATIDTGAKAGPWWVEAAE